MFGRILSGVIKVATLPIDAVEIGADMCMGGDGSKESRRQAGLPLPSDVRDAVCDVAEDID
jgi:hypothetical protein